MTVGGCQCACMYVSRSECSACNQSGSVSLFQLCLPTGFNLYLLSSFVLGVDVIAKFAQLEFRYGDAEKGRTMFDKVLTSYPKRTDLWSVFIDLMVKHGTQKEVR